MYSATVTRFLFYFIWTLFLIPQVIESANPIDHQVNLLSRLKRSAQDEKPKIPWKKMVLAAKSKLAATKERLREARGPQVTEEMRRIKDDQRQKTTTKPANFSDLDTRIDSPDYSLEISDEDTRKAASWNNADYDADDVDDDDDDDEVRRAAVETDDKSDEEVRRQAAPVKLDNKALKARTDFWRKIMDSAIQKATEVTIEAASVEDGSNVEGRIAATASDESGDDDPEADARRAANSEESGDEETRRNGGSSNDDDSDEGTRRAADNSEEEDADGETRRHADAAGGESGATEDETADEEGTGNATAKLEGSSDGASRRYQKNVNVNKNVNKNINSNVQIDPMAYPRGEQHYRPHKRPDANLPRYIPDDIHEKLHTCDVFRDNIIIVMGYLLRLPDGQLSSHEYASLELIYNALKSKNVYMYNTLSSLHLLRGKRISEQFAIVLKEIGPNLPAYMKSATEFWIQRIKQKRIKLDSILSRHPEINILAGIPDEAFAITRRRAIGEMLAYDMESKLTEELMGPIYVTIFQHLERTHKNLSQSLFGTILRDLPNADSDPVYEEYVTYIAEEALDDKIPNWSKRNHGFDAKNPYTFVVSLIDDICGDNKVSLQMKRAFLYIRHHFTDTGRRILRNPLRDTRAITENGVDIEKLLKVVVPYHTDDIDEMKFRLRRLLLRTSHKEASRILADINRFKYNTPKDLLLALLVRLQTRLPINDNIQIVASALLSNLLFPTVVHGISIPENGAIAFWLIIDSIIEPDTNNTIRGLITSLQHSLYDDLKTWDDIQSQLQPTRHECTYPRKCLLTILEKFKIILKKQPKLLPENIVSTVDELSKYVKTNLEEKNAPSPCYDAPLTLPTPDTPIPFGKAPSKIIMTPTRTTIIPKTDENKTKTKPVFFRSTPVPSRTKTGHSKISTKAPKTKSKLTTTIAIPHKETSTSPKATSKPSKKPSKPSKSTYKPSKPTSKPSKSTSKHPKATPWPSKSTSKPSKATSKKTKETSKPSKNTSKPSRITTKPSKVTSKHTKTTPKPSKASAKPSKITSKPSKITSKPSKTTLKSPKIILKPSKATTMPLKTTLNPSKLAFEKSEITLKPSKAPPKPSKASLKPSRVTMKPSKATPRPSGNPMDLSKITPIPPKVISKPPTIQPMPPKITETPYTITMMPANITTNPPKITTKPSVITTGTPLDYGIHSKSSKPTKKVLRLSKLSSESSLDSSELIKSLETTETLSTESPSKIFETQSPTLEPSKKPSEVPSKTTSNPTDSMTTPPKDPKATSKTSKPESKPPRKTKASQITTQTLKITTKEPELPPNPSDSKSEINISNSSSTLATKSTRLVFPTRPTPAPSKSQIAANQTVTILPLHKLELANIGGNTSIGKRSLLPPDMNAQECIIFDLRSNKLAESPDIYTKKDALHAPPSAIVFPSMTELHADIHDDSNIITNVSQACVKKLMTDIMPQLSHTMRGSYETKLLGENWRQSYPTRIAALMGVLKHALRNPKVIAQPELRRLIRRYRDGLQFIGPYLYLPMLSRWKKFKGEIIWSSIDTKNHDFTVIANAPPKEIEKDIVTLPVVNPSYWILPIDQQGGDPLQSLLPHLPVNGKYAKKIKPLADIFTLEKMRLTTDRGIDLSKFPNRGSLLMHTLIRLKYNKVVQNNAPLFKLVKMYLKVLQRPAMYIRIPREVLTDEQYDVSGGWTVDTADLIELLPTPKSRVDMKLYEGMRSFLSKPNLLTELKIPIPPMETTKGSFMKVIINKALLMVRVVKDELLRKALRYYQDKIDNKNRGRMNLGWIWSQKFIVSSEMHLGELIEKLLPYNDLSPADRKAYDDLVAYFTNHPHFLNTHSLPLTEFKSRGEFLRGFFEHLLRDPVLDKKVKEKIKKLLPSVKMTGEGAKGMPPLARKASPLVRPTWE